MTKASQKLHCVFSGKEFPNYEVQKADLERKVKWCQIYRLEPMPKKQWSAANHKRKSQIKKGKKGWGDGSEVRTLSVPAEDPGLVSSSHDGSQVPLNPVLEDLVPSNP